MKLLGLFILFITITACDPYNFGFKRNPVFVLNETFEAVTNLDVETFNEYTGKEALCLYGTLEGLNYLRSNLDLNLDNTGINLKLVSNLTKKYASPIFINGFWSYYSEKYLIEVHKKDEDSKSILNTLIECNYGTAGERVVVKEDEILSPKKYKKKDCTIIKITPVQFTSLAMTQVCKPLQVKL